MKRIKRIRIKQTTQRPCDTVVFMSAYDVRLGKKKNALAWKKKKTRDLLKSFHIIGLATPSEILTQSGKTAYTTEYNPVNCTSKFNFDSVTDENKSHIDSMLGSLTYLHSAKVLLDEDRTHIKYCFCLESFLVSINDHIFQVDPFAYMLNGVLITSYELIHFDTGRPLSIDEIGGRTNNYNILPIEAMRYFDGEAFIPSKKTIPEIIYNNVWGLLEAVSRNCYTAGEFSFVHNILVFSNNISSPAEYFKMVLGAPVANLEVSDIGASKDFEYYSKEYLGLVTSYSEEKKLGILVDLQILEALKTFLLLQMVLDVDVNHKLQRIIDHQIYTQSLFHQRHVPVITMNVIDNLQSTISFVQHKSAIDFKVNALRTLHERHRAKNETLLNILLYVLALIGSFQTLDILSRAFAFSFGWGVLIISILFGVLGVIWLCRERHK